MAAAVVAECVVCCFTCHHYSWAGERATFIRNNALHVQQFASTLQLGTLALCRFLPFVPSLWVHLKLCIMGLLFFHAEFEALVLFISVLLAALMVQVGLMV